MKIKRLKIALALAVGAAWMMALRPVDASDWYCGGCWGKAVPASQHFPALAPATCGVLFNLHSGDGVCKQQLPLPEYPCKAEQGCFFWYQVLCQGNCGNVVPGLFSLGDTALPLYTPCGTNQALGELTCGSWTEVNFFVYDVTSGATAVKTSAISCSPCEFTDKVH